MALMLTLMIMMLLSALMVGFMTAIMADQRSSGVDRDQTQVYSVAHAGLEKLTSDLAGLFSRDYSPSGTAITALTAYPPSVTGFTYIDPDGTSGYKVQFTADGSGNPIPDDPTTGTTIAAGPYQGFKGLVTHYNILVTARSAGGSEVRMKRELQTVAVPVFQFGLFSESSLSFHAADDFNFGGRIHTNGDLFLSAGTGNTLTLGDRVTAVGEVVRKYLDNGISSTTSYGGTVNVAKATGVYRALANTEGSVVGTLTSAQNEPKWTTLSVGTYNGYIRNGRTGARRLDLPLVANGAQPVDLIRRPPANENTTAQLVYQQRYYTQASLRILLSDADANLTVLPAATATAPVSLETGVFGGAPLAMSAGTGNYKSANTVNLIGGRIKIEMQTNAGVWADVTAEILGLGVTGRNISSGTLNTPFTGANGQNSTANGCLGTEPQPNAIIRLQRVKDVPSTHSGATATPYRYDCASTAASPPVMSPTATDYWPNVLYDTREGLRRDESGTNASTDLRIGGAMYYVELDTNNLARWFRGLIGATGNQAKNDNGFIVYFSDRRNNRNTAGIETGEFGNEDIINPTTAAGTSNGGTPEAGEDVNGNNLLDTYGATPTYQGTYNSVPTGAAAPLDTTATPNTLMPTANTVSTNAAILRSNRPIFFRRALKLSGGANLRTQSIPGLTIASENPVYVEGNYNSTATNTVAETHIACAIIADAITLLSNQWNDINSFTPTPNTPSSKNPNNTGFRFAAVTGKNISFDQPTGWTPETNFGMDGGAHNLLRFLEGWDSSTTVFYRGSIVSFYISRQAIGTFKCCNDTYTPGVRTYNFDTDFLLPQKLPPATPMFRDVNTLTFRQLLRPNQ